MKLPKEICDANIERIDHYKRKRVQKVDNVPTIEKLLHALSIATTSNDQDIIKVAIDHLKELEFQAYMDSHYDT